jgi:hypothetical protein
MAKHPSGILGDVKTPTHAPHLPENLVEKVIQSLSGELEAVFTPWIADRIELIWLEVEDDRLGMTRFEEGANELLRCRRLRLDPGAVTIGLHPALAEDVALYEHTFVHELLHASGLTLHSKKHDDLTNHIAPPPKMSESPLLQKMREEIIGHSKVSQWNCKNCGFVWDRKTVTKPKRCFKCAKPL